MGKELTYLLFGLVYLAGCRHKTPEPIFGNFPAAIGAIFSKSCAVAGCHTEKSKMAAGGLSLMNWQEMFDNEMVNAVVIPYSPGQSPIFFFVNTFADLGPVNIPTMPVGSKSLCREEVLTIKNWLNNGAPSAEGKIMYADDLLREKVYVLNFTCNSVSVIDTRSGKIMRQIDITGKSANDRAEVIKTSADRKNWYVLFVSGVLQKFDASNDHWLETIYLGNGGWRDLFLVKDKPFALATSYTGNSDYTGGKILIINTEKMIVASHIDSLYFPKGSIADNSLKNLYASCNTGNFIYSISIDENFQTKISKISINQETPVFESTKFRPAALHLTDDKRILVVCENSNEIRVLNQNNKLEQIIKIGLLPQEICCNPGRPEVFVSCTEDKTKSGKGKGNVYLINYLNGSIIRQWYSGYQPKGLAMNKENTILYVAHKNADPVGADAPHHYTACKGTNGYITKIDLTTFELVKGSKTEVSVQPVSIALR